jgi:serine/threonine protein kinase
MKRKVMPKEMRSHKDPASRPKERVLLLEATQAQTKSEAIKKRLSIPVQLGPHLFRLEQTGSIYDKYEYVSALGRGMYGEVFKMRHKETKELRAVKIISKSLCSLTSNVLNEVDVLKRLVECGMRA